jgi:8-oxo-dGTP pyrophosphatase MutT (NUDIX family)
MVHFTLDYFRQQLANPDPLREQVRQEMMYAGRNGAVFQEKSTWKESAVLMILWKNEAEWHTLLMQRNVYEGAHSGQISFPGGRKEEVDVSLWDTAIRETNEETSIAQASLTYLGHLSPLYIPVSGFYVHPFVAFHDGPPSLKPNPREVHHFLEVPLLSLWHPVVKTTQNLTLKDHLLTEVPGYGWKNYFIWGATAILLREAEFLFVQR